MCDGFVSGLWWWWWTFPLSSEEIQFYRSSFPHGAAFLATSTRVVSAVEDVATAVFAGTRGYRTGNKCQSGWSRAYKRKSKNRFRAVSAEQMAGTPPPSPPAQRGREAIVVEALTIF